jgi:prepilin-type N-terminal cleavage/methylation domain-containing protein
MSNKPSSQEQGFTLVELLIAIAVSALIISALVFGFITTMRGTASAHDRFVASNGNHSLATYFTSDVQSANATTVSTDPTANSGCSTTEAGTTNVVRLQWFEKPTSTEIKAFSVSYRTRKVGSVWQLVRYACSGSGTSTTAAAILGAAIPASQVMVSELYDPTATPSHPTVATNTGREVTLTVFSAIAQDETEPYEYTVSANLRSLSGGTTTTTTSSSTTSTSTSTSTTTSSTTTTTTTAPTATKLGLVSCVKSDGTTVSCAGTITLTTGQWVDISVQLQDAAGNAVNSTSSRTVNVGSTPTGSSNKFTVTGDPVTIATGTSQSSGPFRVTRSANGGTTVTVTASSGSLTSASVAMS